MSGSGFGALIGAVTLAAGQTNNLSPALLWPTNYGRIILTSTAGAANLTGLMAGLDTQPIIILNALGGNAVTLNVQNSGSFPANQFYAPNDLILVPGNSVLAVYTAALNSWVLA